MKMIHIRVFLPLLALACVFAKAMSTKHKQDKTQTMTPTALKQINATCPPIRSKIKIKT